jgi:hypothetical protein
LIFRSALDPISGTPGQHDDEQIKFVRVVTDMSQLYELAAWSSMLSKSAPVVVRIPGINEEAALSLQALINRYLPNCGCAEGAVFLLVGSSGYIAFAFLGGTGSSSFGWSTLWIGLGVACIAAMLGKLAGLIRSQFMLRKLIRRTLANSNLMSVGQRREKVGGARLNKGRALS